MTCVGSMVQENVTGRTAENSETRVNGFNTTEDVFDVSALFALSRISSIRNGSSLIHDSPSIEAGQASAPNE